MRKLIADSARDSSGGVMWAATSLWRLGPRGVLDAPFLVCLNLDALATDHDHCRGLA